MILVNISPMEIAVGVLIFTLLLLLFIIGYRKLLAHLSKGTLLKENYCVLYSLEINPAFGDINFYFTSEKKREVKLELLDENYNFIKELYNQECKSDGNMVHFNTKEIENGIYFYSLVTENQKTMKKMTIRN